MRPHVARSVVVFVVCLLTLTLYLPSASTSNINEVPVIQLSSIHGYTAEISDYHFDSEQRFCFTLTNTSPLPINAIGGDLGGKAGVTITSESGTNPGFLHFFVESPLDDHTLNGIPMSFVLYSLGGLPPGAHTTICLEGLGGSADQIAHNLFVTFFPEVSLGCADPFDSFADQVLVQFTRSSTTEQCIIVSNSAHQPVTGVGVDLSDLTYSLDFLSLTPPRQPFKQHLRLSTKPGRVSGFKDAQLSFALLSGGQFSRGGSQNGVQPFETSSEFCIEGNFPALTTEDFVQRTYVRVGDQTRQCINVCCPVGKGQTGVLAGEPR